MNFKWIGAALVIAGCGGFGFSLAAAHNREMLALRRLISALDYMECDLQYHLTPLPDLCRQAGKESKGCIGRVLTRLAQELECQVSPDVQSCMAAALAGERDLTQKSEQMLRLLGNSLGRFDLPGQLKGLESVRSACRRELTDLETNKDARLRGYQTLGLCAGTALAILFI